MKKKNRFNDLMFEHELFQCLQEECAEVIQEASKCVRFGTADNLKQLEKELGDLFCLVDIMHKHDMISFNTLDQYILEKQKKLKQYTNLIP